MRRLLIGLGLIVGALVVAVAGHMALIELGREVVTLRTQNPDGTWRETRLWIVDDGGYAWLHSAGDEWLARFQRNPIVELERHGEVHRYRATPVPGPHPRIHELLRAKYGIADRWVRFIGPDTDTAIPVRLELVTPERPGDAEDGSARR